MALPKYLNRKCVCVVEKAVTILGRGPSWQECPFRTEELWGASTCLLVPILGDKPYTKVFAFDNDAETMESIKVAQARHIPIVGKLDYVTEKYPVWDIVKTFQSSYFMNTISYMLAYAIYQGYNYLHIYGIDQGPQWCVQSGKSFVTFWLGVATGRGIRMRMGRGSLRFAYNLGLDSMPRAYLENEKDLIFNNIGEEALKAVA